MYKLVVLACVFVAAVAQMMLKKGATIHHASLIREYMNPWVWGGYLLMGFSMIGNVFAMSHGVQVKEVSIIESFSYLFVPLLSLFFFHEKISVKKVISIVLILMGTIVFFL